MTLSHETFALSLLAAFIAGEIGMLILLGFCRSANDDNKCDTCTLRRKAATHGVDLSDYFAGAIVHPSVPDDHADRAASAIISPSQAITRPERAIPEEASGARQDGSLSRADSHDQGRKITDRDQGKLQRRMV